MGVLSWGVGFPPNFQCPLASKLYVWAPTVFEVQERARCPLSPCQIWRGTWTSPAAGWPKNLEFFVCLSVTLLNVRVCAPDFAMKALGFLIPLDRGRFVVVHSCSTFSGRRQLATPQNAEVNKMVIFEGFSPPEGDKIYRSRLKFGI